MIEVLKDRVWLLPGTPYLANHYLLATQKGALLIEAARHPEQITPWAEAHGLSIQRILVTHGHSDHIGQLPAWRALGLPLMMMQAETPYLEEPGLNLSLPHLGHPLRLSPPDEPLQDDQVVPLDDTHALVCWHTPGHTFGSGCFLLEDSEKPLALFTGDTLISTSIGRTDFPGGDAQAMRQTLFDLTHRLRLLPEDLPVFCGHDEPLTVGDLLRENLWLVQIQAQIERFANP